MPRTHRTYKDLSLVEAFRNIYSTKAWGDIGEPFCSGSGSRGPVAELYCEFVIKFIIDYQVKSVVDLGCGDFAVGRRIVEATGIEYTGIDVVPELIEHHKNTMQHQRVFFSCADITKDPLPSADLCLIRQVFQHLSNDEIAKALTNIESFPRAIISEDVPDHPKSFNRDKPHGPDVRAYFGSGVYIDRPPFSIRIAKSWNVPLAGNSLLRTVLLDRTAPSRSQEG